MTILYALLVLLVTIVSYYNYISIWPYYIVIHFTQEEADAALTSLLEIFKYTQDVLVTPYYFS